MMVANKELKYRKRSRFKANIAKNREKLEEQARESLEQYNKPLRDRRTVAPKTEYEKERAWQAWVVFFKQILKRDPHQIWVDLLDDKPVNNVFQSFLKHYVQAATTLRPCLGPEEYEEVRGLNSAISVLGLWKSLLAMADDEVFREKRRIDPERKHLWTTMVSTKGVAGKGPIYSITKWIEEDLAGELSLTRHQTFEKHEMTPDDIILLLGTLWSRGTDISCDAKIRIAFHGVLLLAGIGGFRPGVIMQLKYDQVRLGLVRDPLKPDKKRLVATIKILQNKLKTKVVRRDQVDTITFSTTLIPCQLLCLTSILVARALADQAFDVNYESLDDILHRPDLGDVDYIPLPWKSDFGDKAILPIAYFKYKELWDRTLLVAGYRQQERPYSMRVGAGGRLDGALEPAVRGYVLSNSDAVFQHSYQPQHVRQDLQRIAFGEKLTGRNEGLFELLQRSSLQRDEHAPIYPTQAQLDELEKRRDLQELRAEYVKVTADKPGASDDPSSETEAKRIAGRIQWIRETLSQLLVQKRRAEYFANADRQRALGQQVAEHVRDPSPFKCYALPSGEASEKLSEFLQYGLRRRDGAVGDSQGSITFVRLLVELHRENHAEVRNIVTGCLMEHVLKDPPPKGCPRKQQKCLLCLALFSSRGALTKHNTNVHCQPGGLLCHPLPCPECERLGKARCLIEGPVQWSNHAERFHGKDNAPNPPSGLAKITTMSHTKKFALAKHQEQCLICGDIFETGSGFSRHVTTIHEKAGFFDQVFNCPECEREDRKVLIEDVTAWRVHIATTHRGRRFNHLLSPKRPREDENVKSASQRDLHKKTRIEIPANGIIPGSAIDPELSYCTVPLESFLDREAWWNCLYPITESDSQPLERQPTARI
ncbi:hypothetical protein BJ170DRAFT_606345 [Xylariales sp. AK1849]|nr:hypothetical protein BJ170DRAFT_606345 [Xylariales sp. AK1849]